MQQEVAILGAGVSGTGAALLGKHKGLDVFVSDMGKVGEPHRAKLEGAGIEFEEGSHSEARILSAAEVIKSPGIPDGAPLIKKLHEAGVPVISEIEFASRYTKARIIGITGSNGKTTTTSLCGHILQRAGLDVKVAGNIGDSFAEQIIERDPAIFVLELSSFQLDGIKEFRPDIAILLNITPDHLDRYDYKLENYADSKLRIAMNQTSKDYFIYCADDPISLQTMERKEIHAQLIPFSLHPLAKTADVPTVGGWVADDKLNISLNHPKPGLSAVSSADNGTQNHFDMSIYDLALQGKHNLYNSMAASIAGRVLDIRKDVIRESLSDFINLEHRLEFVAKVHGMEFINDSKATNVNSTWYALESMNKPLVWIAGGVDKGNDYSLLTEMVSKRVKAIVCIGKDNRKIHEAFSRHVDLIVNTQTMTDAVRMAYHFGDKGDAILLSPACASFDLFTNYEDRGRQYKDAVRAL